MREDRGTAIGYRLSAVKWQGKKGKTKRHYGANHIVSSLLVGDNRIELVPQRTFFEGARATRKKNCESRMQEVK